MNDYDTPEIRCSLRNLSRVTECLKKEFIRRLNVECFESAVPAVFLSIYLDHRKRIHLYFVGFIDNGMNHSSLLMKRQHTKFVHLPLEIIKHNTHYIQEMTSVLLFVLIIMKRYYFISR